MTLTKQEIIALAVEAGLAEVTDAADSLPVEYVESLAKFAALAHQRGVRDEREACAKLCEAQVEAGAHLRCAAAIRARSDK